MYSKTDGLAPIPLTAATPLTGGSQSQSTEPVVRVYAEAGSAGDLEQLMQAAVTFVQG